MTAFRERTRRFITTLLFLLLGPGLLGFVGYRLYWRTTPAALGLERERLSTATRFDVDFELREFLRPNVRRLTGVSVSNPKTAETTIFCPETYFVREKDDDLFREFVRSFDRRSGRAGFDERVAVDEDSAVANSENRDVSTRDFALESALFPAAADSFNERVLVVVPTVYCRDSQLIDVKNAFCDAIFQKLGTDAFPSRRRVLAFVVERIVFQDETEFERTRREFVAPTTAKSRTELTSIFRTAALQTDRGDAGAEETTEAELRRETIAFASEEPVVEKFRALYVASPDVKRLEAQFELAKIAAASPAFLALETRRDSQISRCVFDASRSPIPCSLAARFFPIFGVFGREARLSGELVASDAFDFAGDVFSTSPSVPASVADADATPFLLPTQPVWTTRLNEFHLNFCDVESLAQTLDLPRFTGFISDFCVKRGAIRRGVFLGSGSVKTTKGTFPQSFLKRICANGQLEVAPASTLALRFVDDAAPFAELELLFDLRRDGIAFDSNYRNKIVAFYKQGDVQYGLFLPKNAAGRVVPYSEPLRSLFATQDARAFWSPLFRNALNHLSVEKPGPDAKPPTLP